MTDRMFMRVALTDRVASGRAASDGAFSNRCDVRRYRHGDERALGELMYRAYVGTVDYEGETPEEAAVEIRRTVEGAYGDFRPEDSFLVDGEGRILSATLLTQAHGTPFVAFTFTDPEFANRGLARVCMEAAMSGLYARGERELRLLVTRANTAAVRLYTNLGFRCEP